MNDQDWYDQHDGHKSWKPPVELMETFKKAQVSFGVFLQPSIGYKHVVPDGEWFEDCAWEDEWCKDCKDDDEDSDDSDDSDDEDDSDEEPVTSGVGEGNHTGPPAAVDHLGGQNTGSIVPYGAGGGSNWIYRD